MPNHTYKYLGTITAIYVTFQLLSDVTASKLIEIFWYIVPVSILYFPFTYVISDILTEVYGYARSRTVIWTVLWCTIIAWTTYQLAILIPPSEIYTDQAAFSTVFGSVPRIIIAWWVAVWTWEIVNSYILAKMKVKMQGRHLWMRTITSTVGGEGFNALIFSTIAFYWIIPTNILFISILASWIIKVLIEILCTPITYFVINRLKKAENEDYYDKNTNFNPFIIWLN